MWWPLESARRRTWAGSRFVILLCAVMVEFGTWMNVKAAVIEARSVAWSDVNSAVAAAKDGDRVRVPAGTSAWTEPLYINKNIILEGAGANSTIVVDEVPRAPTKRPVPGDKFASSVPRRRTNQLSSGVLVEKGARKGGAFASAQHDCLVAIDLSRDLPFRMSGFTFKGGSVSTKKTFIGIIRVSGTCHAFRIDHCTFDQLHGGNLATQGFLWGVIDHCHFNLNHAQPIRISHQTWNGGDHGHGSWADDPHWGSERFVFIEDNVFENPSGKTAIDAYDGARFVVRHNQFHNCGLSMHGTEASGRGGKEVEEYENTYRYDNPSPAGQIRSGSIVTHDNTWTKVNRGHVLEAYRLFGYPQHWGFCNGENPYDDNAPKAGTGYWETGKHTGPEGASALIDSTKHWAPDQWHEPGVVYIVRNKTLEAGAATLLDKLQSFVISNTANTITLSSLVHGAPSFAHAPVPLTFNSGDTYQLWKVNHALDQPGMGKGDLLTGLPGQPAKWPHEVSEPCYSWNNHYTDGRPVNLSSMEPCIEEGRDFLNETPKPRYKPFVYPHPLVSAGGAP